MATQVMEQLLKNDRAYKSEEELISVRNSSYLKIDLYASEIQALIGRNGSRRIARIFLTRMDKELRLAEQVTLIALTSIIDIEILNIVQANNILCISMEPETLTKDFRKQMMLTELVDDLRLQVDDYLKLNGVEDAARVEQVHKEEAQEEVEEVVVEEEEEEEAEQLTHQLSVALPHQLELVKSKDIMATWQYYADDAMVTNQLLALLLAIFISQLLRRRFHVDLANAALKHSSVTSVSLLLVSTISGFLVFLLFEMTNVPPVRPEFITRN